MLAKKLLFLLGFSLLSSLSQATTSGNGVTGVPMTDAVLDKDLYDRVLKNGDVSNYAAYYDVSQERVDQLKPFPPYIGKSDEEIREKVRMARLALMCAIELSYQENPEIGINLKNLTRYRLINFALTDGWLPRGATIVTDGSVYFGPEPINISFDFCEYYSLSDIEIFWLYNELAKVGQHAIQAVEVLNTPSYATQKLSKANNELTTTELELERICEMLRVVEYIAEHNAVPSNATKPFSSMGQALVDLEDSAMVLEWRHMLQRKKHAAGEAAKFWQKFGYVLEAEIEEMPGAAELSSAWRRARLNSQGYGGDAYFAAGNYTTLYMAQPAINGTFVGASNIAQYNPLTNSTSLFAIDGVQQYYDFVYQSDSQVLVLASTGSLGQIWEYDCSVTGAVDFGSGQLRLELPELADGGTFYRDYYQVNSTDTNLGVMAIPSADLYDCMDTNADGKIDFLLPNGYLQQNAQFKNNYILVCSSEELTAVGMPTLASSKADYYSGATRTPSNFWGNQTQLPYWQTYQTSPGVIHAAHNSTSLVAWGTPGNDYEIATGAGGNESLCNGTFSSQGSAVCSELSGIVDSEYPLVITDTSSGATQSFDCATRNEENINNAPSICGQNYHHQTGQQWTCLQGQGGCGFQEYYSDPNSLTSWDSGQIIQANQFGTAAYVHENSTAGTYSRFDYLQYFDDDERTTECTAIPNVANYFDISDPRYPFLIYTLISVTFPGGEAVNEDLYNWFSDGSFSIVPLTYGGDVTVRYFARHPITGAFYIGTAQVFVDYDLLYDPEEVAFEGPDGELYVDLYVLPIGGEHYPLLQFKLTNSPFDNCLFPHWHQNFGAVRSLEEPFLYYSDPDPIACGYGIFPFLFPKLIAISLDDWYDWEDAGF